MGYNFEVSDDINEENPERKCLYCGGYHHPEDPHLVDDHGNLQ